MRNIFLIIALFVFINNQALFAEDSPKEENKKNELIFKARKSVLWLKHEDPENKFPGSTIQTKLSGEIYDVPKEIIDIKKKNVDRSTPSGAITSYFSASEKGDLKWIVENFLNEEQEKLKSVLGKKTLKDSKSGAQGIDAKYITGHANYNGYTIIFVEQQYSDDRKVTEAIACKKTDDGWRLTNSLSEDKTFDIVFAALNSGEVTSGNKRIGFLGPIINKPIIELVR